MKNEIHEHKNDNSSKAVLDSITIICTVVTIIISTILLTSWFLNLFYLTRSDTIYKSMSPGSSLSFIVSGCALLAYFYLPVNHNARKLAKVAVAIVLAFDLIILIDFITRHGFNIERFILPQTELVNNVLIGWMSPITAASLVISSLSLFLLLFSPDGKKETRSIAAYLASISLYIGTIVCIGYLYGTPLFYGGITIPTSLSTAITILFFSFALLTCAGTEYFPLRLFIGDSVRARLMRAFIPAILVYILLEGILKIVLLPYADENVLHSSIMIIFFFMFGVLITSGIAQKVGGEIDQEKRIQSEKAAFALCESESKFRTIFETIPDGLGLIRLKDDLLIEANDGISKMFGYTKDELIGKNIRDLNIWFDPEDKNNMIKQLHAGDFAHVLEVKYRKKNGDISIGTYHAAKLVVNNEPHLIISTRDISFRKGLEEDLLKNRALLLSVVEGTSDAIYIKDLQGKYLLFNSAAQKVTGKRAAQTLGKDDTFLFPPEEASFIMAGDRKVIQSGRIMTYEEVLTSNDGEIITFLSTKGPLFDTSGKPYGLFGIARNITDRKLAEEEREAAIINAQGEKSKSEAIIAALGDGIIIQDTNYIITYQNKLQTEIYGEHSGEHCYKVYENRDTICEDCPVERTFRDGKIHRSERSVPLDGKRSYFELTSSPLRDSSGKIIAGVKVVRDITDQKLAEAERLSLIEREQKAHAEVEAARKLEVMKSMFIASTSHELRTPLNAIIGFSSLILAGMSGEINEEQKMQIGIVHSSATHLLALISDIIDLSKIEAGKIDVNISQFDLGQIINEAVTTLGSSIKDKGLSVSVEVEKIQMRTDRMRLFQCLLNIIGNSVKYTERGSIKVITEKRDNYVDISVADTGIGIKAEDIPKLFQPFMRFESHLTLKTPGTGLGLYLAQKLAGDFLRGGIDAKSEYGKGSTFILKIPVDIQIQPEEL